MRIQNRPLSTQLKFLGFDHWILISSNIASCTTHQLDFCWADMIVDNVYGISISIVKRFFIAIIVIIE